MNIMELGAIGELVGGIAVVVTLLYLAVQVRQGTVQARQDAVVSAAKQFPIQLCTLTESAENVDLLRNGLRDFDSLPPNEAARFNSLLLGLFSAFASVVDVHRAGLVPIDEFKATEGNFVRFIKTPGGRQWWDQTKGIYPERLVAAAETALVTRSLDPITERWRFLAPEQG